MRLDLQLDSFQKIEPELIRKLKLAGISSIENLAIKKSSGYRQNIRYRN